MISMKECQEIISCPQIQEEIGICRKKWDDMRTLACLEKMYLDTSREVSRRRMENWETEGGEYSTYHLCNLSGICLLNQTRECPKSLKESWESCPWLQIWEANDSSLQKGHANPPDRVPIATTGRFYQLWRGRGEAVSPFGHWWNSIPAGEVAQDYTLNTWKENRDVWWAQTAADRSVGTLKKSQSWNSGIQSLSKFLK